MKEESRWKLKGSGWRETPVEDSALWQRQWIDDGSGVIRRDYGNYYEMIFIDGGRIFTGEGGGYLTFSPSGTVDVEWRPNGALASALGTGNRTHKVTKSTGKRTIPKFDETFALVKEIRECFIISPEHSPSSPVCEIPGLPSDPNDPQAIGYLETFRREAYLMLSAIVRGDAKFIEGIAAAVKHHEGIRTGEIEIPIETCLDVKEAIREAAIQAGGVPARLQILKEFNDLVSKNRRKEDIRGELAGMGFSWMHEIQ